MSRKSPETMHITEGELTSMTKQLDDMHNSTFPGVQKTLSDFADDLGAVRSAVLSRRGILTGASGVVALGALAACGSSTKTAVTTASPSATPSSAYSGDLKVVALAAALENLAVAAYTGALKKASAGQLGTVPPAIATFITTVRKQHTEHAAAWNAVLSKAKLPTVKGAPLTVTAPTVAQLNAVNSVPEVAKLALSLENIAADTYTFAVANVKDSGGIMTAATIQPVEAMHASILYFVLGQYPVPNAFITEGQTLKPDQLTQ